MLLFLLLLLYNLIEVILIFIWQEIIQCLKRLFRVRFSTAASLRPFKQLTLPYGLVPCLFQSGVLFTIYRTYLIAVWDMATVYIVFVSSYSLLPACYL